MSSIWLVTHQHHDYYDGWDEGQTKGYWNKKKALKSIPSNYKELYNGEYFKDGEYHRFSTRYVIKEIEMVE